MGAFLRRAGAHDSWLRSPLAGSFTLALLVCFFGAGIDCCFGQTFTATLTGVVSDQTGAVVPNVAIQIKNKATGDVRDTTSGPNGSYIFSNLLPGKYELTAKAQSFKTFVQREIELLATRAAELNISLQLGELAQTMEVTGAAVLLDTKSANNSATLPSFMVTELPNNTRNPFNFVYALAGTTPGYFGGFDDYKDQDFTTFGLNGGRAASSQILLDGAPATAADWGGLMVAPLVDSVQEMQVVRNTYDAQYGRSAGGIVNVISKSGTDKFHGEGYDFIRAENLDATPWTNNTFFSPVDCHTHDCNKQRKGEFKRHQFGGNIGGPIWRSKRLFFFAGFEGLRQPYVSSSGPRKVPTSLERQGDFSATYNPDGSLQVLFNPFSTRPDPSNPGQFIRDPFDATCVGVMFPNTCAGNKIPSSLIDPVGAKVVALFPQANRSGTGFDRQNNFFNVGPGRILSDKMDARIDWAKSDKYRAFGRWSQRIRQNNDNPCFYCNGADTEFSDKNPGFHVSLDNTLTPSPTWVVSVLLGSSYWVEEQRSPSLGVINAGNLGLNPSQYQAPVIPEFRFGRYAGLGNQKVRKFPRATHSLQVNSTKELRSHSLKFGWMGETDFINNVDRFSAHFEFGRGMTSGPVAASSSSTSGNEIASLLLGTGAGGNTLFNPDIAMNMRYYGFYGQDTWRVNSRLTVTLGLRYDLQPGATERFNRLTYFDLNVVNPLASKVGLPLKGGFEYASSGNRRAWATDKTDFAPRIGLAYKWTDKLVVRAGYGVYYVPASAMITFDQPGQFIGFSTTTDWVASAAGGGLIPQALLRNPFPSGKNQPTGNSAGLLTDVGTFVGQVWPKGSHPTGYKQNFSLDFQYQLNPSSVIEVGYSGYRARKLMFGDPGLNVNQLPSSLLSLGTKLDELVPNPFAGLSEVAGTFLAGTTSGCPSGVSNCIPRNRLLRPFPEFDGINWTRSLPGATNNFDAITAKFTRRFTGGLTLLSTYQWSRNLDDASEDNLGWAIGSRWRDYYNRKLEYSVSAHDIPNSFVTDLVYELPFGRGKRLGTNLSGVANEAAGGWQVTSIIRFASGLPVFPIGVPNNLSSYGFTWQAANLVGNPSAGGRTTSQWFNPAAFASPANFTIGNAPRYNSEVREQGAKNVDLGVMKEFKAEAFKIQFRAEFLNLFNTPQFGGGNQWWSNIQNCIDCGQFGKVVGVRNLPRNIQLGLKVNF